MTNVKYMYTAKFNFTLKFISVVFTSFHLLVSSHFISPSSISAHSLDFHFCNVHFSSLSLL